jgi:hypothetical protein
LTQEAGKAGMKTQTAVKRRGASAGAIVASTLLYASLAWACTSGAEVASANPSSAPAGDRVTVTGNFWLPGTIEIFLSSEHRTTRLGTVTVSGATGSFATDVTIPADFQPGIVRMSFSLNGVFSKVAQVLIKVLPPVAQPVSQVVVPSPVVQPPGTSEPVKDQPVQQLPNNISPVDSGAARSTIPAITPPTDAQADAPAEALDAATKNASGQNAEVEQPVPTSAATPSTLEPVAALRPETWTANLPQNRSARPSLIGDRANGPDGLPIRATLLALASVATFAGVVTAVARRR